MARSTGDTFLDSASTRFFRALRANAGFDLDLRSLAASRIAVGGVILLDTLFRLQDFRAHYGTDAASAPTLDDLDAYLPIFRLWTLAPADTSMALVFAALAAAAACFALGYRARAASFACWILYLNVQSRNPWIVNTGDRFLQAMLFWTAFLPIAEIWSLDSRMRSGSRHIPARPAGPGKIAAAAFLFQFFYIYFVGAVRKMGPEWWGLGTAIETALANNNYATSAGLRLLALGPALPFLTRGVLVAELLLPFFLFLRGRLARARMWTVFALMALHLMFSLCLSIGMFSVFLCAYLIALIPSCFWEGRNKKSRNTGAETGAVEPSSARRWQMIFLLPFAALAFVANIYGALPGEPRHSAFVSASNYLGLQQRWTMFAPHPSRKRGWYRVYGLDSRGRATLLRLSGSAASGDESWPPFNDFPNDRWHKLLESALSIGRVRAPLAAYFCRANPDMDRIRIVFHRPDGLTPLADATCR